MHLSCRTQENLETGRGRVTLEKPKLTLLGKDVKEIDSFKYLGVTVDSKLRWNVQAQRWIANTTNWILQFRRLTKPSTGVKAKLMRQLYLSAAIPKMTYRLDVWYTPPNKLLGAKQNQDLVSALRGLQKAHRIASLAICGMLRMSPTDLLDAHAGVLPTTIRSHWMTIEIFKSF